MQPSRPGQGSQGGAGPSSEGYALAGPLSSRDVKVLYARCGELRFSGRLSIVDGERRGTVDFVGGEPVEVKGEDPAKTSWRLGSARYTLEQAVPDLRGALTGGIVLDGALRAAGPTARDLLRHCEDSRLTAELSLDGKEHATLLFAHGRLESLVLDGAADLGALTRIERWVDGRYRLTLRPLFSGEVPTPPPALPPQKDFSSFGESAFDVTGGVMLAEMRPEDQSLTPPPELYRKGVLTPTPTPIRRGGTPASVAAASSAPPLPSPPPVGAQGADPFLQEDTKLPTPIPGERLSRDDVPAVPRREPVAAAPGVGETDRFAREGDDDLRPARRSAAPIVLGLLGVLVVGGGIGAWYVLGKTKAPVEEAPPGEPPTTATPSTSPAPGAPTPPTAPTSPAATPTEPAAAAPSAPPVAAPTHAPPRHEPSVVAPPPPAHHLGAKAELLVAKGRKLLVAGHAHTARDALKAAQKLAPDDPLVAELLRMAAGKTGKGDVILEGKGTLRLCGQPLVAPKRLKLPAGPYTVEREGTEEEVRLTKGGKLHLRP